jgi:choline dehydrogenase-like flavoprotein
VYGCRHGGKQSVTLTYLRDAQEKGADIIARCQADRLVIEKGRIIGVDATITSRDGVRRKLRVSAKIVVAACGSLHTPALLLRSGVKNPQLGRNLYLHPTTGVGGLFEHRIAAWEGAPQSIVCNEFAGLRNGYGFRLETAPAHPGLIGLSTPWTGARSHREEMQMSARAALIIVLVRDKSGGRVTIDKAGRPVIDYRPGTGEQAMIREGLVRGARAMDAAGALGVHTVHTRPLAVGDGAPGAQRFADIEGLCAAIYRSRVTDNHLGLFSAHQMGTCRMGRNSSAAVCDERGEVFGVRGLFIADASAFPGSSGVNPMISVMALADHTARQIEA